MATPQTNAKHYKTRLKNWFVLAISAASFVETTTLHDLTIDVLPAILATIDVLPNPPAMIPNLPALISPRPTPYYATPLTPSLVALLLGDPPHQLERNISATFSPSSTYYAVKKVLYDQGSSVDILY